MLVGIDAVGIREGGGAEVLTELLHWLPRVRPHWRWQVFLFARGLRQFDDPPLAPGMVLETTQRGHNGLGRVWWVNHSLPCRLKALGVNVVLSFANLGAWRPSVPQVVFCQQQLVLFQDAHAAYPPWQRLRLRAQSLLVRPGARASAAVVVQTEVMRRRFLELEPSLEGRVHVIPSGVRLAPAPLQVRAEKQRLIDAAGRPRLLYVSTLRLHKNHQILLRALPAIAGAFPEVSLLLTADREHAPSPEVADLLVQLRRTEEAAGIGSRLGWLGHLTQDEVAYALCNSDLVVFPSLAESFGLPLAEAMTLGCPVVAADLPYAREVAGPAAVYFDPQNAEALADCVLSLLGDPARSKYLLTQAAERKEKFSWKTIAEQFAQVLEPAAAGSSLEHTSGTYGNERRCALS